MIITKETSNTRSKLLVNPTINNFNQTIELRQIHVIQSFDGSGWIDFEVKKGQRIVLNNNQKINPSTLEISEDGTIGIYDYILTATADDLGIEDTSLDSVFEKMAIKLNTLITVNELA